MKYLQYPATGITSIYCGYTTLFSRYPSGSPTALELLIMVMRRFLCIIVYGIHG